MSTAVTLPAYRNPELPIDQRVADLLLRMTLEEKAAQMVCVWNEKNEKLLDPEGRFDAALAARHFANGLGQIGRPGDSHGGADPTRFAELTNAIQRHFVRGTRLGIPVLFHDECLHGLVAREATSFPQPIGLAASFNTDLVERVFHATAREARACGVHQALAPVLDVARDPRWGRVEETFGEDPHLVGRLGAAAVRGFQGDRQTADPDRVISTLKHFAAHGQPESGNNCAPTSVSERHLRETFLDPFEQAIRAGAMSVMASYNEIDGVPSHANGWLLQAVLRGEWGFDGTVVSDYYAIRELWDRPGLYGHGVAGDAGEAAAAAVRAGVNIELPEPDCYQQLVALVREGDLLESDLDRLVAPMLRHKFELGLFESPYVDPAVAHAAVGCDSHQQLALEAAHQSITLLKNNDAVLPLDPDRLRSIAVVGPNADRVLLGGYSGVPKRSVTLLEGLRAALEDRVEILHAQGCGITVGGSWDEDRVVPSDPEDDRRMIEEAIEVARRADLVVLAVGGNEQTSREAWDMKHLGDRTGLELFGRQDELADALHTLDKPIVSLLFNGRPLAIGNLADKSTALLECWYLGQESGGAAADVLLGRQNPSGKLPISFPRSVGHLPVFYNHRPSARRGYLLDDASPLFPFGFGLSYTSFHIDAPTLTKPVIHEGESTAVRVRVENTGDRPGAEVVQLYIRDVVSSVTRPVLELKGFHRVELEPSEETTIELPITPKELAFWNLDKKRVVEPGEFEIMVGPNSIDLRSTLLLVTPND